MSLPLVTIVGRPNVGKSSLLNMLAGRRISIVDPTAGVTRDRIQTLCDHHDTYFELVDTGGYGIVDRDDLDAHVERQIAYAVKQGLPDPLRRRRTRRGPAPRPHRGSVAAEL